MIPGFFASGALNGGGFVPDFTTRIALPLTYDEADYNALLTWTRSGGPLPTPDGGIFDGSQSRLVATSSLPAWLTSSSGALTVHASVAPHNVTPSIATAVGVCVNDASANPKLGIASTNDAYHTNVPVIVAQAYTGSLQTAQIVRKGWVFDWRYPETSVGGFEARPQGILFEGASTLLVCAHYEGNVTRFHRVRVTSGEILGWFDFDQGLLSTNHINAIAMASDGSTWAAGNGRMFQLDLSSSFSANEAVVIATYDITAAGAGFLDIAMIGGTEYVICGEYLESGSPYLYVFPYSLVVDAGVFNVADRTIRYVINQRTQGINYHDGNLYMSMNRTTAEGSGGKGWIHRYALNLSGTDGSSMTTPDASWVAPSQYPEDLDFHPTTGALYCPTEGYSSVGSSIGWLSIWHSALDGETAENHITLDYNGAGTVTIKVNGKDFETRSWTPTPTPGAVSIGGKPAASAGWSAGFFSGTIRNIVIQDSALTSDQYTTAVSGLYEASTLTVIPIALTNPGCETGDTTGWTNETGALGIRTSAISPFPHSGSYFFFGGPNAATKSRQRLNIESETGLTTTQIDAGGLWARISWWQAGFSVADADTGTMGLRYLDGTPTQISESAAPKLEVTPELTWFRRSFSAQVPSGARNIDALFDMTRASGTNLDCYVDDIELTFYRQ